MSQRFPIRFSDRTWNLIDAAATAEGITPASWVRRLVEGHLGARCPACGGSRETPEVVPFHGAGYAGAPATAKRCEDVFHASIRKGSYHVPQTAPEGLSQPRSGLFIPEVRDLPWAIKIIGDRCLLGLRIGSIWTLAPVALEGSGVHFGPR